MEDTHGGGWGRPECGASFVLSPRGQDALPSRCHVNATRGVRAQGSSPKPQCSELSSRLHDVGITGWWPTWLISVSRSSGLTWPMFLTLSHISDLFWCGFSPTLNHAVTILLVPDDLDLYRSLSEFCLKHQVRSEAIRRFEQRSNSFWLLFKRMTDYFVPRCSNNTDLFVRLAFYLPNVIVDRHPLSWTWFLPIILLLTLLSNILCSAMSYLCFIPDNFISSEWDSFLWRINVLICVKYLSSS